MESATEVFSTLFFLAHSWCPNSDHQESEGKRGMTSAPQPFIHPFDQNSPSVHTWLECSVELSMYVAR
jgi:hypothetical protein